MLWIILFFMVGNVNSCRWVMNVSVCRQKSLFCFCQTVKSSKKNILKRVFLFLWYNYDWFSTPKFDDPKIDAPMSKLAWINTCILISQDLLFLQKTWFQENIISDKKQDFQQIILVYNLNGRDSSTNSSKHEPSLRF